MRGFDFIASLPDAHGSEREAKILDAVRAGHFVPHGLAEVHSTANGHRALLHVTTDVFAIGEPNDWVRVSVSATLAQQIADYAGMVLPTSKIVDLVHAQASVRLRARPHLSWVKDGTMSATHRMLDQHAEIEKERAGRLGLASTVGKDWVLAKILQGRPNIAATCGWHDAQAPYTSPGGIKLWQNAAVLLPGGVLPKRIHNRWHVDYAQLQRFVCRTVVVDGQPMTFTDVLRSPELAPLVSYEGVLSAARYVGVPEFATDRPPAPDADTLPPIAAEPEGVFDGQPIEFIGARNFTVADAGRVIDWIVLHTMENDEKPNGARNVALWMAGAKAPQASMHYAIGAAELYQCVRERDVAWAAPGANRGGIQLELVGRAAQTPAQWDDAYSRALLERAARLGANVARRRGLPAAFVDREGLLLGRRGFTTHNEATQAGRLAKERGLTSSPFYKASTTHWDPGPSFPMDRFLELVRAA